MSDEDRKKKMILELGIGASVVAVLGAGAYFLFKNDKNKKTGDDPFTPTPSGATPIDFVPSAVTPVTPSDDPNDDPTSTPMILDDDAVTRIRPSDVVPTSLTAPDPTLGFNGALIQVIAFGDSLCPDCTLGYLTLANTYTGTPYDFTQDPSTIDVTKYSIILGRDPSAAVKISYDPENGILYPTDLNVSTDTSPRYVFTYSYNALSSSRGDYSSSITIIDTTVPLDPGVTSNDVMSRGWGIASGDKTYHQITVGNSQQVADELLPGIGFYFSISDGPNCWLQMGVYGTNSSFWTRSDPSSLKGSGVDRWCSDSSNTSPVNPLSSDPSTNWIFNAPHVWDLKINVPTLSQTAAQAMSDPPLCTQAMYRTKTNYQCGVTSASSSS